MKTKEVVLKYLKTYQFNADNSKRFELTISRETNKKKEKTILVIGLNPTFKDIYHTDITTTYISNNLFQMGYDRITVWNLSAIVTGGFKVKDLDENEENMCYLLELLKRNYDTILIGYGSSYEGNKKVNNTKNEINEIIKEYKGTSNIVELVDEDERYSRMNTIHPLFAGQRFSHKWKLRKYVFKR